MDEGGLSAIPRYLLLIFFFILGGAYFAAAETSFASVNRIRMISEADDGNKRAKKVLYILDNFDTALTTLLIGNNIMHISCSSVATLAASKLWGNKAVTASTFIITFIVFIFVEMIPKAAAKACNEQLAPALAPSMAFLMKLLLPISFFFSGISKLISLLLGSSQKEEPTVTEEELFDVIENIDEKDDIDEETTELVQSALEFTETTAADILIPWNKAVVIKEGMREEQITALIKTVHYSRLPVVGNDGSIKGILQIRKFLKQKLSGNKIIKLGNLLDKIIYIRPTMAIDKLLDYLSSKRTHMAIVRSDAGEILGIVTIEDILEELVGEIYDEEEREGDD